MTETEKTIKDLETTVSNLETIVEALSKKVEEMEGSISQFNIDDIVKSNVRGNTNERKKLRKKFKELKESGMSYRAIAEWLNIQKIPTISGTGEWHGQQIYVEIKKYNDELKAKK